VLGPGSPSNHESKKAESMFREMGMEYWLDRTRALLERGR
jgi:hypothetical protein